MSRNSTSRYRYAGILILAIIGVVVATVLGMWRSHDARMRFFSHALAQAHIREHVSYDSVVYEVRGADVLSPAGESSTTHDLLPILRLAYEKAVARHNPLYALAGTDPSDLMRAIAELEKAQRALIDIQTKETDTQLTDALYPISFLRALASTEAARLDFLAKGTIESAFQYEATLKQSIKEYQDNIARFGDAFEKAVPTNTKTHATDTYVIRRDDVISALSMLSSKNMHIATILDKRNACFGGHISQCDAADLGIPELKTKPVITRPETLSLARDVESMLARTGTFSVRNAPYIELSESTCVGNTQNASLFFLTAPSSKDTFHNPSVYFVGDLRFVRSKDFPEVPFFSYFASHHVPYVFTTQFNHYECPTISADVGAVLATQHIRDYAKQSPLSAIAYGKKQEVLKKIEGRLTSAVATQADAIAYLNAAATFTKDPQTPREMNDHLATLSLEMRNKSAGLDRDLLEIANSAIHNIALLRQGIDVDLSLPYLFFVRSGFPVLFLFADASTKTDREALFPVLHLAPSDTPYVYYSGLPSRSALRDELVRDISFYNALYSTQ